MQTPPGAKKAPMEKFNIYPSKHTVLSLMGPTIYQLFKSEKCVEKPASSLAPAIVELVISTTKRINCPIITVLNSCKAEKKLLLRGTGKKKKQKNENRKSNEPTISNEKAYNICKDRKASIDTATKRIIRTLCAAPTIKTGSAGRGTQSTYIVMMTCRLRTPPPSPQLAGRHCVQSVWFKICSEQQQDIVKYRCTLAVTTNNILP